MIRFRKILIWALLTGKKPTHLPNCLLYQVGLVPTTAENGQEVRHNLDRLALHAVPNNQLPNEHTCKLKTGYLENNPKGTGRTYKLLKQSTTQNLLFF